MRYESMRMIFFPAARTVRKLFALLALGLVMGAAIADDRVYLEAADFIAAAFPGATPQVRVLWVTPEIRAEVVRILGHEPAQLRQKYWTDGQKSAWILEEIGKEDPITAGFVVRDGRIDQARVLIYRESRGGEIRYPSFVAQFHGAALADGNYLNKQVDGISGATLSVNAMLRMSRQALYFARMATAK